MNFLSRPVVLSRIVLPALLLALSGISLRSHPSASSLQQARLAAQAGDSAAAAFHYTAAAQLLPARPDLWEQAGHHYLLVADPEAAVTAYLHALDAGNLSSQGCISLGRAFDTIGDQDSAVRTWNDCLAYTDPSPDVYALLADAAQLEQDFSQAAEYLQAYIQLVPGDAGAQYRLGLLFAATQPRRAASPLSIAREIDPALSAQVAILLDALRPAQFENPPAYIYTLSGQALGAVGEWQLAHLALHTATELDPTYPEAWAFLGEAVHQLGGSGQVELEVAWGLNPDSLAANTLLSIHWQRRNDYQQALFFMLRAAEIEPHNPSIQADLGALYLRDGDLTAARDQYQHAIDLAPTQAVYWRLMAEFCLEHEIFISENGLPAAERLVALESQDPGSYVLLGRAHFLLLDDDKAEQAYLLALQLDPEFAPAHLYLALLYIRLGEMESGHQHLVLARGLDPDGQTGLYARQLLAQYFP